MNKGFTLVELLIATMLMSVVMLGIITVFATYWRIHADFVNEESTMQEISLLSRVFSKCARSQTSENNPNIYNGIIFTDDLGISSSITYDSGNHSVLYDPDISRSGDTMELLANSVIADFTASIEAANGVVKMYIDIVEEELGKTNRYFFSTAPRNQ